MSLENYEIAICKDKVELREVFPKKAISLQAFVESMRNQFVASTPIIPREVVGYFKRKERQLYLIEEEPKVRKVDIRAGSRGSGAKIYSRELAFPFVYHLADFYRQALERISVFCMPKRMTSMDEKPCHLPLPNIGHELILCTGNSLSMSVTGTLHSKVRTIIEAFWSSQFNFDLSDSYVCMPKEIKDLTEEMLKKKKKLNPRSHGQGSWFIGWERLSQKEGFDICKVKWMPWSETLAQYVERLVGGRRR
jgi:hypothetical protein